MNRPLVAYMIAVVIFGFGLGPSPARALPVAPSLFCQVYPDAPGCQGRLIACSTCHTSTAPAEWNPFGTAVYAALGGEFLQDALEDALEMLEEVDSDDDGAPNLLEIQAGSNPGDAEEVWLYCPPELPRQTEVRVPEGYDFRVAYRRTMVLYCGRSPTIEEYEDFDAESAEPPVLYDRLHATLRDCLSSVYWRDEGLHRLADARIRPLAAVGANSAEYLAGRQIIIADYDWDYRLWSYVLTGDRDARELLTADYHVIAESDGQLTRVEGPQPGAGGLGQDLDPAHRAGMITTTWFMAVNTMFTPLPRTTAAQAYRAYLGLDIAYQEGLMPVSGEPQDIDHKGVDQPTCAQCHTTLEPLSYPFAFYNGIAGNETGTFNSGRPTTPASGGYIPDWDGQSGTLLGQPLPVHMVAGEPTNNLRDWAEIAIASDFFKRNLALAFYRHALNRDPATVEIPEFEALWHAMPEDGYSANLLIGRIVDTAAFGGAR